MGGAVEEAAELIFWTISLKTLESVRILRYLCPWGRASRRVMVIRGLGCSRMIRVGSPASIRWFSVSKSGTSTSWRHKLPTNQATDKHKSPRDPCIYSRSCSSNCLSKILTLSSIPKTGSSCTSPTPTATSPASCCGFFRWSWERHRCTRSWIEPAEKWTWIWLSRLDLWLKRLGRLRLGRRSIGKQLINSKQDTWHLRASRPRARASTWPASSCSSIQSYRKAARMAPHGPTASTKHWACQTSQNSPPPYFLHCSNYPGDRRA